MHAHTHAQKQAPLDAPQTQPADVSSPQSCNSSKSGHVQSCYKTMQSLNSFEKQNFWLKQDDETPLVRPFRCEAPHSEKPTEPCMN